MSHSQSPPVLRKRTITQNIRVAFNNNKGGTMKTAGVLGLAEALAAAGYSVLAVDMDPQRNVSRRLGVTEDPNNATPTVSDAIKNSESGIAAQALHACGWEEEFARNITVLPAVKALENRVSEAAVPGAVRRLRVAMEGVDHDIDFTLFDCQPSLGHLTQMALAAADASLSMAAPEFDDVEGAVNIMKFVREQAVNLYNPELRFLGVVPTRVREQLGAHQFQLEGMPDIFGTENMWEPRLPERTAIKDANDAGVPLRSFKNGEPVAELFDQLAANLVDRLADLYPERVAA